MSFLSAIGIHTAQEIAAKKAADEAAKKAAAEAAVKAASHDAGVDALRKELAVDANSPVEKIVDSFQRSNQLVYSNGSNWGPSQQSAAARALLDKEVYGERRWEIFPEEEYTRISSSFDAQKLQTLFRTQQETSGEMTTDITRSLVAPVSPDKVVGNLPWKSYVIHDKVSKARLPVSNLNELFTAAKSFLGLK